VNGLVLSNELLEQALHLVRRERTRPKQASLRRAVSAAYYALFHLLIAEAILNWKHVTHRPAIARHFQHAQMRTASEAKKRRLTADLSKLKPGSTDYAITQGLLVVADAFVQLQDARHTADYDLSSSFEETKALSDVYLAVDAFKSWKIIRTQQSAQDYLLSLLSLLIKDR
jgi:uncharacterized protein (UPF0332 family)